ncbi:hypothetical protein NQ315_013409 [Exocentrus adspersus]|uniref:Gag protein n=1 Tax=Exocentrus adspersus TaxID=1586481 RepID=A0AAV8VRJ5_9CUCU|nr:hypothetical protein NQ315_013409 [Exocentrus adspersus]
MATGVTFSEFNGEVDNWQMYSERLAEYFKANDVGEGKQVAKLLSILSPSTYKLLRDLCFPDLPNKKTFKQLSELLAGHYGHKPVVWHERSMFQDAKQEPGETISQWYARICSLAVDCKYQEEGELKNKLKEKFVTGMIRGRIFNRICEEDATITLEKLVEVAKNKENILSEEGEVKVVRKFQRRGQQFERKERENGADQHGAASKRQDSRPSASSSSRGQLSRGRRRRSTEGFTMTDDITKVCKQCKSCNRKHDEATQTNSNKDVTPSAERVKVGKDCHSLGRTQEKCRPSRQCCDYKSEAPTDREAQAKKGGVK